MNLHRTTLLILSVLSCAVELLACDQTRFQQTVTDLFGPLIRIPQCDDTFTRKFEEVLRDIRASNSNCLGSPQGCQLPGEKYLNIYHAPVEKNSCTAKYFINISVLLTIPSIEKIIDPKYDYEFRFPATYYLMGLWYWLAQNPNITIGGEVYCTNVTVFSAGYTNTSVIQAANDIINNNHPNVVLGPWSSGLTESVVQLFEDAKIPFFGFASTSSIFDCTVPPNNNSNCKDEKSRFKYAWSLLNSGVNYYDSVINMAKLRGFTKMYIWSSEEIFTRTAAEGAENSASRSGFEVVRKSVPSFDEIPTLISDIKEYNPDLILFIPRHTTGCIEFVKQLSSSGFTPKLLVSYNCIEDPMAKDELQELLVNTVDIIAYHEKSPTSSQQLKDYYNGFEEMFGVPPDHLISARVHDLMDTIKATFEEAGTVNTESFISTLRYIKHNGITGAKQFDTNHMNLFVEAKSGQLVSVDKLELIYPTEMATHEFIVLLPNNENNIKTTISFVSTLFILLGLLTMKSYFQKKIQRYFIVACIGTALLICGIMFQSKIGSKIPPIQCIASGIGINWGLLLYLGSSLIYFSTFTKICSKFTYLIIMPIVLEVISSIFLMLAYQDEQTMGCTLYVNPVSVVLSWLAKMVMVLYVALLFYKVQNRQQLTVPNKELKEIFTVGFHPIITVIMSVDFLILEFFTDYFTPKLYITAVALCIDFCVMGMDSKITFDHDKENCKTANPSEVKVIESSHSSETASSMPSDSSETTNSSEPASSMPESESSIPPSYSSSETASSMPSDSSEATDSSETASSLPEPADTTTLPTPLPTTIKNE